MTANTRRRLRSLALGVFLAGPATLAHAQLVDKHQMPNAANEGITKSFTDQIANGRGDETMPDSSMYIIKRDPYRAVRRGRQLFQRKFVRSEGQGRATFTGDPNLDLNNAMAAGLADSCASCHGRPRGSAGSGGAVATRPDSRDAPHLFGLGLKEMLADEITGELRAVRSRALSQAKLTGASVTQPLTSKNVNYGTITAKPDGTLDTSQVSGIDPDLRVRPFAAHGGTISIREFVVAALNNELGLQAVEPDLMRASKGGRIETPAGMRLDGSLDAVEAPVTSDPSADPDGDGVPNEIPEAVVDYLEFYLLNYFKPAVGEQTDSTLHGRQLMDSVACTSCHVANMQVNKDRRVADLDTAFDPVKGIMNRLFATAKPLIGTFDDLTDNPALKIPAMQPFLVTNIFTDLKRHDLGPNFYERNYDGSTAKLFMTSALWGVASTGPYGHDGRSVSLHEVILRHGGEAQGSRDMYAALSRGDQRDLLDFLGTLVLFPPDDTASSLDPGNPSAVGFPQAGHGSIKLTVLFNDPTIIE